LPRDNGSVSYYGGFEVVGAEEIHKEIEGRARSLQRPSVEQAEREKAEVVKAIEGWSPREVKLGSEMPKVEARLRRATALIVVLPPRHALLAAEASYEIGHLLEWAEGAKGNVVLVYYSRKGTMTTAAYLYLGNIMEDSNVGILFVNGPPSEIAEVFSTLDSKGEYTPNEESYVRVDF